MDVKPLYSNSVSHSSLFIPFFIQLPLQVMGAVVSNTHDPMMVLEYMEYGSLHDLLRNETMVSFSKARILWDIWTCVSLFRSLVASLLHPNANT